MAPLLAGRFYRAARALVGATALLWLKLSCPLQVLVPARRLDQLFGEDAEDLFADEKRVLPAKTTALQV